MKAVVTGCAGFIGSHLTERLLKKKYNIIGIDSFTDFYSKKIKEKNIKNFLEDKNFELKNIDIIEGNLKQIVSDADYVFHLAGQAGVRPSWGKNFEIYTRNNIDVTQKLLEAYIDSDIKKFVFASSSSVYGDTTNISMAENSQTRPISPYGVTKLAAENLCYLYWKNYKIPTISLRYFTVYGPRQRPDMAIAKFTKSIINNEKIEIYGDGKQTRDFTHISDIVKATVSAAESGIEGEVFNIGGGSRISINELINILEKESGKKAIVKYVERQHGDMTNTLADISKARRLLKYNPKVNIEIGINKYIEWFKSDIND